MTSSSHIDTRALLYASIALLTWSSAYASISYTMATFSAGDVVLGRLALGSVCFLIYMRVRRLRLPPYAVWPQLLALGAVGLDTYHLCLNEAETRVPSSTAAILVALTPAATAAVSALWLRERLTARALGGLTLALGGVVTVVLTSDEDARFQPKELLLIISVVAAAIYFTAQKPWSERYGAEAVTTVTMLGATLGALPFGFTLPQALLTAPPDRVAALLWLGLAPTFIGYLSWNKAILRSSASRVASLIYCSTPAALLISWLWLGDQPNAPTLAGGVIVVIGVILANSQGHRGAVTASGTPSAS